MEGITRCWIEEAQTISRASLDDLIPTIRTPGSEIWFTYNPRFETDPVDVMFKADELPPSTILLHINWQDNPWFPDVLKQEMDYDKRRDTDKYLHIWEGQYQRKTGARVFNNWTIEEFTRPAGTVHRLGADWGFSVDPSVLVRCDIEGNRLYVDYEAYAVGCEIVNLPELFMSVPDAEKWPITVQEGVSVRQTLDDLDAPYLARVVDYFLDAISTEQMTEINAILRDKVWTQADSAKN